MRRRGNPEPTPTTADDRDGIGTDDRVDNGPVVIELEVIPIGHRPGFDAAMLPDGRCLIRATRQPTLDGARALMAEDVAREAIITTRLTGSAIAGSRTTVGWAAKSMVKGSDRGGLRRVPWQQIPTGLTSRPGGTKNERNATSATGMPIYADRRSSGGPGPRETASVASDRPSLSTASRSTTEGQMVGADSPVVTLATVEEPGA